jgi:histidinol dehydrogenase
MEPTEIAELSTAARRAFFDRDGGIGSAREAAVEILGRVREQGDVALRELAREFDDCEVGNIEITDDAERAWAELDPTLRDAIETATSNVRAFHERQRPEDWTEMFEGRELGRRFRPIERAGVYVPGGTAAYPSSAIMGVTPAVVAGVEHIAVATPPATELDPATLGAIHHSGADAVYQMGGAQAVGALAYGTESVDRVQKIVGPGNAYVAAAKAEVRGAVEIDFLAGPSEILCLCDGTADPALVAADLVAQAEHDPNASVVAVTADGELAAAICEAVTAQLADRERTATIREALANDASGVLLARSMAEAVLFADEYAAEHLSIVAADERALADRIPNAGSVFLGADAPVAAGDYAVGPNHVLPTTGGARTHSGLSVDSFLRSSTIQRLDREALGEIREAVTTLARAEGLEAHAHSVDLRFEAGE